MVVVDFKVVACWWLTLGYPNMMGDANYDMVVILITTQLIHYLLAGTECT